MLLHAAASDELRIRQNVEGQNLQYLKKELQMLKVQLYLFGLNQIKQELI
jgi:hypothetical protein